MKKLIFDLANVLGVVFILVLGGCSNSPKDVAGTGSGTESALVMGHIYYPDGTPASNAIVQLIAADQDPRTSSLVAATVTTDVNGRYSIKSLTAKTYNLLAEGDSGKAFHDSIKVDDDTLELSDTLHDPGILRGIVKLEGDIDTGYIFVILLGTNTYATADTNGNFTLADMPAGTYNTLVLTTVPEYASVDTELTVHVGADEWMNDTIFLRNTGVPIPENLSITYDTLRQIVTLTWAKADTALAKGYYVYRRNVDSNTVLARINTTPISDTLFRDSTGVQDMTYEYKVVAVSPNDMEGTKSAVIGVKMVSAFAVLDTVGSGEGAGDTKFSGLIGIAIDSNNNIYAVNNGYNMVQKFDSSGNFLFHIGGVFGSDSGQFRYPTDVAVDSEGNVFIGDAENNRIQKFDRNGNYLLQWGRLGDSVGQFREIFAVTVYHGFVFVSEKTGSRVQKFDLSGNFLLSIDVGSNPKGIAVTDNAIFIIAGGTKVKQYNSNGTFVKDLYVPVKNSSITYVDGVQINDLAIFGNMILVLQPYDLKVVGVDVLGNVVSSFNVAQVLPESWGQRIEVENQTIYISTVRGFILKYVKK